MEADLKPCIAEMKRYFGEGYIPTLSAFEEPLTISEIYSSRFHSLKPKEPYGKFLSVDASSLALLRANNWRIGVSRCAFVIVEKISGQWTVSKEGYRDYIFSTLAPIYHRQFQVLVKLKEFESQVTAELLDELDAEDFCLMDGAAFFGFGEESKYSITLYNKCREEEINLLMVSKNSPKLRDNHGRDLLAAISMHGIALQESEALGGFWIYHPIVKSKNASRNRYREMPRVKDLYGDVACVKLSAASPRVFRCDIMDYLVDQREDRIIEIASEVAHLSNDARCDGYPAPLFLAHQRTRIPEAKLLEYLEAVQQALAEEGLLEFLLREAHVAGFRKQLLGLTFDFEGLEDVEV